MSMIRIALCSLCVLWGASSAAMAETVERSLNIHFESEVFATRGETALTQADFDARLHSIPEAHRVPFLASPERIQRVLEDELLLRLLAEDGIRAGTLDDELTQALLWQSAMHLIAERHVENVLSEAELDDYTQQAHELWLTRRNLPLAPEEFDFTHLLVSSSSRPDALAAHRAWEFYESIAKGAELDELVRKYSEDPAVEDGQKRYTKIEIEDLEPEFATALTELSGEGEISEPIRTRHGWHIIRLDRRHPRQPLEYEEALPLLKETARQSHRESIRDRYYASLFDQPGEIKEGAVRKLLERYGVDTILAEE